MMIQGIVIKGERINVWEFPVGQWLGLGTFIAVEPGSVLDQGTKILQAVHQAKKTKRINF